MRNLTRRDIPSVIVGIGLGIILRGGASIPLTRLERITGDSLICLSLVTMTWLSNRERDTKFERKLSELYQFAEFGRLSSGVFHDLINPLTSISLIVQKLKEDGNLPNEKVIEHIDQAIRASKRMQSFLHTAKKQLKSDHQDCSFSVQQEIDEAVRLLQYKIRTSGIEIRVETTESYEIYGNPLRFFRVMVNLLSNAIDSYRNTNETIRRQCFVVVRIQKTEKYLEISVRDQGCGIPDDVCSLIFNPFFTTKPECGGIGLGLSMTKQIIEKSFKGCIKVESKSGEGSTFTVKLPLGRLNRVPSAGIEPTSAR